MATLTYNDPARKLTAASLDFFHHFNAPRPFADLEKAWFEKYPRVSMYESGFIPDKYK